MPRKGNSKNLPEEKQPDEEEESFRAHTNLLSDGRYRCQRGHPGLLDWTCGGLRKIQGRWRPQELLPYRVRRREGRKVDSTRTIVLGLFPANERGNMSLLGQAERVGSFADAKTLRTRLDAFVELFNWLRVSDRRIPEPLPREPQVRKRSEAQWKRERVWLSVLEASPEVRERYLAAIATILHETDAVALFAESGLPNDRGLVPETIDRLFRIVLPAPREETDLARLFLRLFPTQKEVDRFFGLPSELFDRIVLLASPEAGS